MIPTSDAACLGIIRSLIHTCVYKKAKVISLKRLDYLSLVGSLSSRDRTPVKSPSTSRTVLRDAAKKRLSLIDTRQSSFSMLESKKTSLPSRMSFDTANASREQANDNLANGLRGLSHEQLVQLIMELVCAQDNGALRENEKLRSVLFKRMPVADIQPLILKLIVLRQNIYASLMFVSNLTDDSMYSQVHIHLDIFQVCSISRCFNFINIYV